MLEESTGNFSASRNVYDWYQTNTHVNLNIMIKNLTEADVKVCLIDETLDVTCTLANADEYRLHFNLFKPIYVTESSWTVTPSKLEIKLKKTDKKRWQSLELIPEKGCKRPPSFAGVVTPQRNAVPLPKLEPGADADQAQAESDAAEVLVCISPPEGLEEEQEEEGETILDNSQVMEEEDDGPPVLQRQEPLDGEEESIDGQDQEQDLQAQLVSNVSHAAAPQSITVTSPAGAKSREPKNWDKIVKEFEEEEEKVNAEGSVDELFKEIYSKGSEDIRRAMNKSFVESAGTVLSTNWNEVQKDKVTVKPPDGVQFKKWDN